MLSADQIPDLRERLAADIRALEDPEVKDWCGRRWRDLFIGEAVRDEKALAKASGRGDKRPERQRIAERFLRAPGSDDWQLDLPPAQVPALKNATLVFCPGLINTMLPVRGFATVFPSLEEAHGWRIVSATAHPMRSCEANVADLAESIEQAPGDVFLLGYSKGTPDALTLLVQRPDLAARVKALVCWAGAVRGSYLADNIYESVKDIDLPLGRAGGALRTLIKTVFPVVQLDGISERIEEFDVKGAIRDLTTAERERFLAEHEDTIDALGVPIFNIVAAAEPLEVPYFQVQGALEIRRRAGDNDMQVTLDQARMTTPLAADLGVVHAHHWDMTYGPFPLHLRLGSPNLDHPFPRQAAITAIFLLLSELGLIE